MTPEEVRGIVREELKEFFATDVSGVPLDAVPDAQSLGMTGLTAGHSTPMKAVKHLCHCDPGKRECLLLQCPHRRVR